MMYTYDGVVCLMYWSPVVDMPEWVYEFFFDESLNIQIFTFTLKEEEEDEV